MPGPGELVIEAGAAGINFPDLLLVRGKYQDQPQPPFTPGKEAAGRVVSLGEGVTSFAVDDRVLAVVSYGGFAERVKADAIECYPIPDAIDDVTAVAAGIAYLTAWFALNERGSFVSGETVLVTGANGGVGVAALQMIKAAGGIAIAGLTTPAKAGFCRANGADYVVDLSGTIDKQTVTRQLTDLGIDSVDLVLEMLGGDIFTAAIRALRFRGRCVCIGFAAGGIIPVLPVNILLMKGIAVTGFRINQYRLGMPEESARAQAEIFDSIIAGRLAPQVMRTYPLAEARLGLESMLKREIRGKIVLTMR
ncbi:NADPH:quinone oxidoreductase family protein [Chelativorans sp. AA-79]|uniref:NADPH:quinone oxidoreductase family protein n=1 Tax=Chelativorans sp. AA-79 TaxID=3028735 RepID=UPI0023F7C3FF|nr:NADPH:quinone oxidoreductase family protein [Chelativorans sp. AA-79]WEX12446.1 NADPH:quinone oxidoreductase family protein [Chelativorans sp. AA-79]